MTRKLKLTVDESKSRVCMTTECVFLGFTFRGAKLRWSEAAFADFKHRIRRLTGRSWGVSMVYRYHRLAQYLPTRKRQAIMTAISHKSYWHLSKTLATQTGMTNKWLESQGLLSVRDLWIKAQGYC